MFEWIGWVATATFASSYFFRRPAVLRRIQALAAVLWISYGAIIHALAAVLWISYGAIIHALPVIVANVAVAALAVFSSLRTDRSSA